MAAESTKLCKRTRRQISGPVKQRQSSSNMLVLSRSPGVSLTRTPFLHPTHPPPPNTPNLSCHTAQPLMVLCCRVVQWKIYDSLSNYLQLSAICACIDGGGHHGDLSGCLSLSVERVQVKEQKLNAWISIALEQVSIKTMVLLTHAESSFSIKKMTIDVVMPARRIQRRV